jgi:hypothetical protein
MAVLIVSRPLLRIAQNLVGFLGFLEVLFGFRVVGIAVGVVLHRQAAIGLLQLVVGGIAIDAQNFVIVSLRHRLVRHSITPRCREVQAGSAPVRL